MWRDMANQSERPGSKKRDLRSQIDENLRRVYADALEQEVPPRLMELLEELRRKASEQ